MAHRTRTVKARRTRTRTDRMTRRAARIQILSAAQRHSIRARGGFSWGEYRMKNLQRAVCVVRRSNLVSEKVLEAAGFNPR